MSVAPSLIMIQFLSWVADRPRTHAQTMDAWRTTCPRLSVWEDAVIEGLVRIDGAFRSVALTPRGRAVLRKSQAAEADASASGRKRDARSRETVPLRQRI